ncbi:MAG: 23S rRNA (cytidine1920-2'-O)/16S rRNA (cytidine1409-2'-O)-methyltransferase [Verrucomicrobia bacterium]|nr:MAG: 23S rRNA (cytidine1920-2'-O)/16S rRNA (cytidine1409-2'-O)-methyltransferase [Verrucomicrobiota bacterium]
MSQRLDQLLVERGLADSREQAKRLILAGEVTVEGVPSPKPGQKVPTDAVILLKEKPRYVSRGGLKLEAALDAFALDVTGRVGIDIGSSTGGFTDCLLQRGALRIHAFDVGTNQLAWKLRQDPRVRSREKFNCRDLSLAETGEPGGIVVIDVSFISLTLILPAAFRVLDPAGDLVCLIKPQFELERADIGKGGIVRDSSLHHRAVSKIQDFITSTLDKAWKGIIDSPITGTDGNREFLAWLRHE